MKSNPALAEITPSPSKQADSNEIAEGIWAKARLFFSFLTHDLKVVAIEQRTCDKNKENLQMKSWTKRAGAISAALYLAIWILFMYLASHFKLISPGGPCGGGLMTVMMYFIALTIVLVLISLMLEKRPFFKGFYMVLIAASILGFIFINFGKTT
jgi:hypothetical protein